MALVEVAFKKPQFIQSIELILTSAPIPLPTFAALGPTRLVSELGWDNVALVAGLAGIAPQPGKLLAEASLTIRHVSVDELRLNGGAPGSVIAATAWLILSASPQRVNVDLLAVVFPNRAPDVYPAPVPIGSSAFRAIQVPEVQIAAAALVPGNETVIIRYGTKPEDDLLTVAIDPEMNGGNWRIRVSGEFFAEYVLDGLNKAVAKPPDGTEVEDSPGAAWVNLAPELGQDPEWAVLGGFGLKKPNACPGLFGDVDLSVSVTALLRVDPNVDDNTLGLNLHISSDASDWDTFRCWAGTGGLVGVALSWIVTPIVGIGVAIGSGIAIGEVIRLDVGSQLEGLDVGLLKQVASDDTSVTFAGKLPLPQLPQSVATAELGQDGLVVIGTILLGSAKRVPLFDPNGGQLSGKWRGYYSCGDKSWRRDFQIPSILAADSAFFFGTKPIFIPVRIFPTSVVEPNNQWRLDVLTTTEPFQYVQMTALAPSEGNSGRLYLHTTAGIRRFDVPPLPAPPPVPDPLTIALAAFNCRLWPEFITEQVMLQWLIDPPELIRENPELRPIRQWLLSAELLTAGSTIGVRALRGNQLTTAPLSLTAHADGEFAFETLTDSETELELSLDLAEGRTGVRLIQRWLVPTLAFDLGSPAIALAQNENAVVALTGTKLFMVDRLSNQISSIASRQRGLVKVGNRLIIWGESGIEELYGTQLHTLSEAAVAGVLDCQRSAPRFACGSKVYDINGQACGCRNAEMRIRDVTPPFSISLSKGQVVAAYKNKLVFAIPDLNNVRTDTASASFGPQFRWGLKLIAGCLIVFGSALFLCQRAIRK